MFNPKSTLLYTWHHGWTHWTYSLKKLIQTELPFLGFKVSFQSPFFSWSFTVLCLTSSFLLWPEVDSKVEGEVPERKSTKSNSWWKTGQINMQLTDIPCHDVTVGCLSHNLRSILKTPSLSLYTVSPTPASTISIFPYSKTQREGKLNWV